jgi:carbon starvation protein
LLREDLIVETVLIVVGSFVFYLIAYNTYGKWLARKIFRLDDEAVTPARELEDGVDFVPSRKEVVFGHHFTSISGTGPIVGPAIAIIWGWVPALVWVLVGSVFMGAVHDFGAVVMSLRNRGVSIADLTGDVICRRARALVMAVVFFELLIVVAIFALVIASVFSLYPHAVIPVWLEIPIAMILGAIIARAAGERTVWVGSLVAVAVMYVTVVVGAYVPIELPSLLGFPPTFIWAIVLFVYAFVASVLPVQKLLQPRDFINSHQLFIALGLLTIGVFAARPDIVAPALQRNVSGAPPFLPFLFITIACGAISGFHALVGSGTTSKQLSRESDAQLVGYGSMLTEGILAVLVIVAVAAGIGLGYKKDFSIPLGGTVFASGGQPSIESLEALPPGEAAPEEVPERFKELQQFRANHPDAELELVRSEDGRAVKVMATLKGKTAWQEHYSSWTAAKGLGSKLRAFVDGSANMMAAFGIPAVIGFAIMGVFVASFAGTTLDTATRLQRYIVNEAGSMLKIPLLQNRYFATGVVVLTAGILALWDGKGAGALVLWPLFGALNQLLASLALLITGVYLYRRERPTWMVMIPFVFMLIVTAWAMLANTQSFHQHIFAQGKQEWHLLIISCIVLVLQIWLTVEAALIWLNVRRKRAAESPAE